MAASSHPRHLMQWDLGLWQPLLAQETQRPYFADLCRRVEDAYRGQTPVYPPREDLFSALRLTPPQAVRCVILGQDPYHQPGQAHGLAFSVRPGVKLPPSLRNIYKERESDLGIPMTENGCLTNWAKHGVLLLNTVLTVYQGQANSHAAWGWQTFTDGVLAAVDTLPQPVALILWGAQAQKKRTLVTVKNRMVIESCHPSPLSANRGGFFGTRPFSRVNEFLTEHGQKPIDWNT